MILPLIRRCAECLCHFYPIDCEGAYGTEGPRGTLQIFAATRSEILQVLYQLDGGTENLASGGMK